MAWTAEDRRTDAPAIQEVLRRGMIVRLVRTMDALDPQPKVGRERVWSTLIMPQASWHLARDGCAWRRLPAAFPPFTTGWISWTADTMQPSASTRSRKAIW